MRPERRRPAAAIVALALAMPIGAVAAPERPASAAPSSAAAERTAFDLAALMRLLAERRGGEARFSEQRFVQGFDAPLRSSGTLAFAPPDTLERRTLAPRAETMRVEGDRLTLTREGRTRSFALDASAPMLAAVTALRGTLTGDRAALERWFHVELAGSAVHWTLSLTPRDAALTTQLKSARLGGSDGLLESVEMEFPNGDRAVTTIEPPSSSSAPSSSLASSASSAPSSPSSAPQAARRSDGATSAAR